MLVTAGQGLAPGGRGSPERLTFVSCLLSGWSNEPSPSSDGVQVGLGGPPTFRGLWLGAAGWGPGASGPCCSPLRVLG